jgi:hypothetical protein
LDACPAASFDAAAGGVDELEVAFTITRVAMRAMTTATGARAESMGCLERNLFTALNAPGPLRLAAGAASVLGRRLRTDAFARSAASERVDFLVDRVVVRRAEGPRRLFDFDISFS